MIGRRPALAPLFEGFSVIEGPWSLFEQRQIVEWIKDVLFAFVTAGMLCQQLRSIPDLDQERICLEGDFSVCPVDWHGVAIGLVCRLAVGREAHRFHVTALIV